MFIPYLLHFYILHANIIKLNSQECLTSILRNYCESIAIIALITKESLS